MYIIHTHIHTLFIAVSGNFSVFWKLKDLKQHFLNHFISPQTEQEAQVKLIVSFYI